MKKYYLLLLFGVLLITRCSDDQGDPVAITYTASITSTITSISEDGGAVTFTVVLDKANQGNPIPFNLSFSGSATLDEDYSVSTVDKVIANGSTSTSFTLTPTTDQDVEEDENITVTVTFAANTNVTVGSNSALSFTLTDDSENNPEPTSFTASITAANTAMQENGGAASFTVALDKANQGDAIPFELNFTGTAVLDEDYSLSSEEKHIDNGSSSTSFTITPIDDQDVEEDENITVTLSFPNNNNVTIGNNSTLAFTFTDDDTNTSSCTDTDDTYALNLDPTGCKESAESDLGVSSVFNVSVSGGSRTIVANGVPDHNVGMFPNGGNPHSISVQDNTFVIAANPTKNSQVTALTTGNGQPRYWFGILDNSVILAPIAAEFFTNTSTGNDNTDWNENALSSNISLGTDCNNSHVFPTGMYHHHATPSAYVDDRNIGSATTTQVGWAADGFPIYYKYGNKNGSVVELTSSFRLKTTDRGGDGVSAPSGCPDGTYTQDYEYVDGLGDLDECNGYEDPTLGYIYVITDTYPSISRCFVGTPSDDFTNN